MKAVVIIAVVITFFCDSSRLLAIDLAQEVAIDRLVSMPATKLSDLFSLQLEIEKDPQVQLTDRQVSEKNQANGADYPVENLPSASVPVGSWFAFLGDTPKHEDQPETKEVLISVSASGNNQNLQPLTHRLPDSPKYLGANRAQGEKHQVAASSILKTSSAIKITYSGKRLASTPTVIAIGETETLNLELEGLQEDSTNIFVRNSEVLSWNQRHRRFVGKKSGPTEVIVAAQGKMLIIPVTVNGTHNELLADLRAPELDQLESLGLGDLLDQTSSSSAGSVSSDSSKNSVIVPFTPILDHSHDLSSTKTPEQQNSPFVVTSENLDFLRVRLQLFDEQSHLDKAPKVPAPGVRMEIVGTQYVELSRAKGEGSDFFVPRGARFLLSTSDPSNYYAPAITEISTEQINDAGSIEIKLMQNSTLGHLKQISGGLPSASSSSLCGLVRGSNAKAMDGISVRARYNESEETPAFYFNELGLPDEKAVTGENGRFCFLSLEPGPLGIEFFKGNEYLGSVPISTFSGKHLEQEFNLDERAHISTHLASLPGAHELEFLSSDHANMRRPVDMADLISLSDDNEFEQIDFGHLSTVDSVLFHQGRSCFVSNATEFTYAHYCIDRRDRSLVDHVTSLIPNGFVSHVFNLYNLDAQTQGSSPRNYFLDPLAGQVIVEHGSFQGVDENEDLVVIELLNERGHSVGGGVHLGGHPLTRGLFFNLEPGTYSVLVQTDQGVWLAMDTVTVYSETTSFLRTGSQIGFRKELDLVDAFDKSLAEDKMVAVTSD